MKTTACTNPAQFAFKVIPASRTTLKVGLMMKGLSGAPGVTRTPGLLIRSQTLYPTELRAHLGVTF
jgi:hypothetical protein